MHAQHSEIVIPKVDLLAIGQLHHEKALRMPSNDSVDTPTLASGFQRP